VPSAHFRGAQACGSDVRGPPAHRNTVPSVPDWSGRTTLVRTYRWSERSAISTATSSALQARSISAVERTTLGHDPLAELSHHVNVRTAVLRGIPLR
jgi:hypothetical protein